MGDVEDTSGSSEGITALEMEYDAARERLNQQREEFLNFSKEGRSIFRMLVLLIGVPATALGAMNRTGASEIFDYLTSTSPVVNIYITSIPAGIMTLATFLSLSIGLFLHSSVSGLEVRGIRTGTNPNDIYSSISDEKTKKEWLENKLTNQLVRIEENDRVLNEIETNLAYGKAGIGASIVTTVTLVISYFKADPISIFWVVGLLLFAYIATDRFPTNYNSAELARGFEPVYPAEYIDFRDKNLDSSKRDWKPPKDERE